MGLAGFTEEERFRVYSILAGLLFLGNVEFEAVDIMKAEGSRIAGKSKTDLENFCQLVGIPEESVRSSLTQRTSELFYFCSCFCSFVLLFFVLCSSTCCSCCSCCSSSCCSCSLFGGT
jgi:hypothetical protein